MEMKELFDNSVRALLSRSGSDMHLKVGSQVVFRVFGVLQVFLQSPKLVDSSLRDFFYDIIDEQGKKRFEEKKFLFFRYQHTIAGESYNFRGTAFCENGGLALTFRFLEEPNKTIQELNLPSILETVCRHKQGLFLVSGPSGQGKSTALSAMIEHINTTQKKIILTIENPIEFIYKQKESYIHQRSINIDTNTFSDAVGSALRSDTDILMVGEINSIQSIQSVLTLSEVGHLSFSTVHANSASEVVHRIVDIFPEQRQNQIRYQLSSMLIGILSMRLLPRIQGGLIPAYELLLNTNAISNLIRENKVHLIPTTIETSSSSGMVTFNKSLLELVLSGEVEESVAISFSDDSEALKRNL